MGKITEVILEEGYSVTVRFDDKPPVTVDMGKKLHTARFSELRDRLMFSEVKTDGKTVYWPGGISITISEIMEIVSK